MIADLRIAPPSNGFVFGSSDVKISTLSISLWSNVPPEAAYAFSIASCVSVFPLADAPDCGTNVNAPNHALSPASIIGAALG